MIDLVILISVIFVLGFLILIKVNTGLSIFIAAILLAVLKGFNFAALIKTAWLTVRDWGTLEVLIIVFLITILADILSASGFLEEIVQSFSKIFSPRIFIPIFAFIIGALPMPGGALVSAPLVEEGSKTSQISSNEKTAINYWFRHIWEPVSPIYPEIILNSAILGVSIPFLISIQWPISVAMIISGLLFLLPLIRINESSSLDNSLKSYFNALKSIFPIILIMLLIFFLKLNIILSIAIGLIYVIVIKKFTPVRIIRSINLRGMIKILFLMFAIFYLKYIVIDSNVISDVYKILGTYNIPNFIILFILPFIVGLMTGASTATFGVAYPMLIPLIKLGGSVVPSNLFIAFVGGWMGVMSTPTHLCLSLSMEYFSAKFRGTYRILIKNLLLVLLLAIIWVLLLKYVI